MASEAVLNEYGLAWLPGVRKIVIDYMSDLAAWVGNEMTGGFGHSGAAVMGSKNISRDRIRIQASVAIGIIRRELLYSNCLWFMVYDTWCGVK